MMLLSTVSASEVMSYADDKTGQFGLSCVYDDVYQSYTVYLRFVNYYSKDMVFPEKVQAVFNDYDDKGGKLEGEFEYYLECSLDLYMNSEVESITVLGGNTIPDYFAAYQEMESYDNPSSLTKVVIGDKITSVGNMAFAFHANLETITLGSGLTTIGDQAFIAAREEDGMPGNYNYDSSLKSLTLPASLGSIGMEAFAGHENLESLTIPKSVYSIGNYAFAATGIETLVLDRCYSLSVTSSPFVSANGESCPLKSVQMIAEDEGAGLLTVIVPAHLFEGVSSAFDVTLPTTGNYQFVGFYDSCFKNSGVKSFQMPTKFVMSPVYPYSTLVDQSAFEFTSNFKSLDLSAETPNNIHILNDAFRYSGIESISLNNKGLEIIGDRAFEGAKLSGTLTIPASVNPFTKAARDLKIGEYAFASTTQLENVVFEGTVEYNMTPNVLPSYAFYRSGLKSITLPKDIHDIMDYAFAESKIESFTAPSTLANIDHDAFASCKSLKSFDISKSQVSSLANNLLNGASALETFSQPAAMISYGEYSLYGVGLKELDVKADIIGLSAFADCPNLETVRFTSEYAIYLPANTISGLPKLKTIDFGKVSSLQKDFINNCPALKTVVIPDGMEVIETGAFNRDNNVDIDTLIFASNNFKAIDEPNKAPFVGMDFDLIVRKTVSSVEKNVFAIAHITNSVELTDETNYDDLAFNMAQIDTLDWHYGPSMPNPFVASNIDKLSFSKIKEVKHSLFEKGNVNNLYLDGIETIGEYAFNKAGLQNTDRSYTVYIPASVKTIGRSAFEDVYTLNLVIEKGTGLTIGDGAFERNSGAWHTLRSEYDKSNIPTAVSGAFYTDSKIGQVFTGSCDDVTAYKAATGWNEISTDNWDGATQYKYSFEVVGGAIDRDQSYYLQNMMLNGDKLPYTAIPCSNKGTLTFVQPCSSITLDHWADGTNGNTYNFELKSDTVIRIYIKEAVEKLNLAVKDPATAEAVKFYIRPVGGKNSEWVEQSSADVNPCDGLRYDVKVEVLDPVHYWFNNWVDEKDQVISYEQVITYVLAGGNLYANIGIQSYGLMVELDPSCWDCAAQTKALTLNGVEDDDKYISETLPYNTEITLGFVGDEQGHDYRYILDYWKDDMGNIVSDENPYTFKLTDYTHLYPVIKEADRYDVQIWPWTGSGFEKDGVVSINYKAEDRTNVTMNTYTFWEGSKIELQAVPANNGHTFFKQWSDGSTENPRQIVVKSDGYYAASFERDSFNITFEVLGIPAELVEVTGAGRYGWGDEVKMTYTLNDSHYHFVSWLGDKTYSEDETYVFNCEKNLNVKVQFNPNEYAVTLKANPAEGGKVTGPDKATYQTVIDVKAEANEGYRFAGWSDDKEAKEERKVEVTADVELTANFDKIIYYTISVATNDEAMGTVSGGGIVEKDSATTITATPKEHYRFVEWNDGNKEATRKVVATKDETYTAKFEAVMFTIAANVNDEKMGSVSGAGSYQEGASVTLTATANEHYRFVEWSDGDKNATRSFTVTKDESFTAQFEAVMFTIAANVNDEKMGSVSGAGSYQEGASVTLTATANDGYEFVEWSNGSKQATITFTATEDATYTAHFQELIVTYTITVLSEDEKMGTVSGSTTAIAGTQVKIEATPAEGYKFVQWNDGNIDNPRTITITGNAVYKAQFAKQDAKMFTITAVSADAEMGSVSGGGEYAENAVAELRAEPLSGYHFVEWKEDHDKTNPRKVTVTANATYTALFEKNAVEVEKYTITVVSDNEQMGTVYGGGEYEQGQVAELIALPKNENYRFVRWDDGTTTNPYYVTVTANATYKAFFEAVPEAEKEYFVSAISPDETKGKVLGSGFYKGGATATLIAIPEDGYKFVRWNDNSKVNPRDVVVDGNLLFVAQFESEQTGEKAQYTISISSSDPAMGEVEGGGEFTLDEGTVLVINAVAKTGYHFVRWEDNSTEMRRVITVNGNHNYIAFFEQNPPVTRKFIVNVLSANDAQGYTEGSGVYEEGQVIIIKAIARQGYEFKEWNDGNKEAIRMVTVTANAKYTASFQDKKEYFRLDVFSANEQQGSVIGSGIYEAGTTVSIAAIPEPGFVFAQWSDGSTENPRDVVVDKDILLIASFVDGSGVENIEAATESVRKVMIDGVIYIIKGDKKYNVLGAEVK